MVRFFREIRDLPALRGHQGPAHAHLDALVRAAGDRDPRPALVDVDLDDPGVNVGGRLLGGGLGGVATMLRTSGNVRDVGGGGAVSRRPLHQLRDGRVPEPTLEVEEVILELVRGTLHAGTDRPAICLPGRLHMRTHETDHRKAGIACSSR